MGWQDAPVVGSSWRDAPEVKATEGTGIAGKLKDAYKSVGMGALKGASDIGATLLTPVDYLLNKTGVSDRTNADRRASLRDFFAQNSDPESLAFKTGELGADIAGTAGVGGLLGKGAQALGAAPKLISALQSGGFSLGGAPASTFAGRAANAAIRAGAGAAVGGASAGLVNPDEAGTGALIGAALPAATKAAGMAGKALAPSISPEVAALYQKAKALGIDIPADRLANNRPLNAVASSLNYVPLSGRAATEERMVSQLNRALSRTFGQDSDNVTGALRRAATDLGQKFERTLSANTVKVDPTLLDDVVSSLQKAKKELNPDGARIIENQIDEILSKAGPTGEIDGQAAYNIKKALDRIGNRNSPEAFYARDLKKSLMEALNRSLGPKEAQEFATVRQQYGNMLELESLAQNGADGGISVGRLANLKNINNPELQDIADIAAQFVKTRENPHGAAQRVVIGLAGAGAAGAAGALPAAALGVAAGRAANTTLNSDVVKNALIRGPTNNRLLENPLLRTPLYVSPANP